MFWLLRPAANSGIVTLSNKQRKSPSWPDALSSVVVVLFVVMWKKPLSVNSEQRSASRDTYEFFFLSLTWYLDDAEIGASGHTISCYHCT